MLLKEGKNLDKAKKILQDESILEMKNAIWFAKYLIDEYVKENGMELVYNFSPNIQSEEYVIDSLGIYRNSMMPNMHDYLVKNSMKINGKMALENLLWYYFLSLGNDVIANELSKNMMENVFVFDNPAGYTSKQYLIYKESLVANTIGGDYLSRYKDFWLNFSEAAIIGGNIFLNIVKDNFSDITLLDNVVNYFEKKINACKMNEYGGIRRDLVTAVDNIIESHPDRFIDNDSDLILEYNLDGKKRNFFELMDMRRKVVDNLENQLEFYDNPQVKEKIKNCLAKKDDLFGEFIYNSLTTMDDDVLKELFMCLNDSDIEFVNNIVNNKMNEVQKIINFIELYDGKIDEEEKEFVLNDWKFEETDCMRLSFILDQSRGIKLTI